MNKINKEQTKQLQEFFTNICDYNKSEAKKYVTKNPLEAYKQAIRVINKIKSDPNITEEMKKNLPKLDFEIKIEEKPNKKTLDDFFSYNEDLYQLPLSKTDLKVIRKYLGGVVKNIIQGEGRSRKEAISVTMTPEKIYRLSKVLMALEIIACNNNIEGDEQSLNHNAENFKKLFDEQINKDKNPLEL